jgi:SAM-dependent methyltransferase
MNATNTIFAYASPADARRWKLVHDVTYKVDRKHFWHVVRNERILATIKREVPQFSEASFLEVGCGVANVLGYLKDHGIDNCTGWEINTYSLALARKRYPTIRFREQDFLKIGFENESFHIVGLFDALEHFEDDLSCLKAIKRLLKPGGTVVLTVPAHRYLWSAYDDFFGHYRRYEKSLLKSVMLAAGLRDIRLTYMMAPLCPLLLASRKRLKGNLMISDEQIEALYEKESGMPNTLVNAIAMGTLRLEHFLLGQRDLGFGAALIATAKAPN